MPFGQLVIGPPGAGKTTYCHAIYQYLTGIGRRVCIINLDPANNECPYPVSINIQELVTMDDVMTTFSLGPNGGLIYCMDYLCSNMTWLKTHLARYSDHYLLFDLPGQVELYTHHAGMKKIVDKLTKSWDIRLTCVNLIDSFHCSDLAQFLSVLLLSLSTMVQLELPHVNVLSKIDLMEQLGELDFGLDFYTEVLDLSYLMQKLQIRSSSQKTHPLHKKYLRLHSAIADLVESYNLVSFVPLDINKQEMIILALKVIDKANGYIYVAPRDVSKETGEGAQGSTTEGQKEKSKKQQQQQQQQQPPHPSSHSSDEKTPSDIGISSSSSSSLSSVSASASASMRIPLSSSGRATSLLTTVHKTQFDDVVSVLHKHTSTREYTQHHTIRCM